MKDYQSVYGQSPAEQKRAARAGGVKRGAAKGGAKGGGKRGGA